MGRMSSPYSSSSRILVIQTALPPHLSQKAAQNVVQAIVGHTILDDEPADQAASQVDADGASSFEVSVSSRSSELTQPTPIPWHISNRYYDADVHFVVQALPDPVPLSRRSAAAQAAASGADVFGALENFPRSAASAAEPVDRNEDRPLSEIKRLVENVPAVVLVCSSDQPLTTHRHVLASFAETVSGFDLEIAIAVGVEAPLTVSDSAGEPAPFSRPVGRPSNEDLVVLYAEHGWEYIRLSEDSDDEIDIVEDGLDDMLAADGELDMSMPPANASLSEVSAGAQEEEGIERIREALMVYMWPDLNRKDDRQPPEARNTATSTSDAIPMASFSDWRDGDDEADDNDSVEEEGQTQDVDAVAPTASLPEFPVLPMTAEPTASDEALARAFLERLLTNGADLEGLGASSHSGATGNARLPGPPPGDASWKELEDFLASEDSSWPTSLTPATQQPQSTLDRHQKAATTAFEDDFSDFVAAPSSSALPVDDIRLNALLAGLDMRADGLDTATGNADGARDDDALPTEQEILATHRSIFGASATEAVIRSRASKTTTTAADATTPSLTTAASSATPQSVRFDDDVGSFAFGSALSSMRSHAQRVQAIADPRQRQKEAARVAMAISWALGEDGNPTGLAGLDDEDDLFADLQPFK